MNNLIILEPPNLAKIGVKRITPEPEADLITVQKTPYPILKNDNILSGRLGIPQFNGGTYKNQGSAHGVGRLTSGFRDTKKGSPHEFGIAIDKAIGDLEAQIRAGRLAIDLFYRIGLYPENGFIHLDMMPQFMLDKFEWSRYWVKNSQSIRAQKNKLYSGFDNLELAIRFAREHF